MCWSPRHSIGFSVGLSYSIEPTPLSIFCTLYKGFEIILNKKHVTKHYLFCDNEFEIGKQFYKFLDACKEIQNYFEYWIHLYGLQYSTHSVTARSPSRVCRSGYGRESLLVGPSIFRRKSVKYWRINHCVVCSTLECMVLSTLTTINCGSVVNMLNDFFPMIRFDIFAQLRCVWQCFVILVEIPIIEDHRITTERRAYVEKSHLFRQYWHKFLT